MSKFLLPSSSFSNNIPKQFYIQCKCNYQKFSSGKKIPPKSKSGSKSKSKSSNKNKDAITQLEIENIFTITKPNLKPIKNVKSKSKRKFKKFSFGLPKLTPRDCNKRVEFASRMLAILEANPEILDKIIFTDEGNFMTNPSKNEQKDIEDAKNMKSFHSDALKRYGESKRLPQIVWCGMTTKYIIGPYFFNSYVTDRSYLKMLQSYLIPQLKELTKKRSMENWWFQQDGNPPHRTRKVLKYLKKTFGPRLISDGAPLLWPPRSQDLTPLDYFLWDHLKKRLHANCCPIVELSTSSSFRKSLAHQIDEVDEKVIKKVVTQFKTRLEHCIEVNGERFDFKE